MSVKLLTEHRFEFVSLKGGCTGSSESTLLSKCDIVGNQLMIRHIGFEPMRMIRWVQSYLKEKEQSVKYHKSSFSCMQCVVSCSSSFKLFLFSCKPIKMVTQLGNYVLCAKSAFVRQNHAPRATRVLKQQQHVI